MSLIKLLKNIFYIHTNKIEQIADKYNNMKESQNHAKCKRPDTKDYALYDCT